jgi:hypothetical protein
VLSSATDPNPQFTGTIAATFTATLQVTDSVGLTATDSTEVAVNCPAQIPLFDLTIDNTQVFEARFEITAQQVTIAAGGDVTMTAGVVVEFIEPFTVESGGTLSVLVDPGADCVP